MNNNFDLLEETIYLNSIAEKSMKIPEKLIIEKREVDKNILIQKPNTLLPVIVGLSNLFAESIFLEGSQSYDCLFPFDLVKKEQNLCLVGLQPNDSISYAPKVTRILFAMHTMGEIFQPDLSNKVDITNLIRTWRETLVAVEEDSIIDLKQFHEAVVMKNIISLQNKLRN